MPVVIGGDNLPSPVGIGLTDLPNIGGGGTVAPHAPPVPAKQRVFGNSKKIETINVLCEFFEKTLGLAGDPRRCKFLAR